MMDPNPNPTPNPDQVLDMMDRTFNAVFDGLNSEYASEQAASRPYPARCPSACHVPYSC